MSQLDRLLTDSERNDARSLRIILGLAILSASTLLYSLGTLIWSESHRPSNLAALAFGVSISSLLIYLDRDTARMRRECARIMEEFGEELKPLEERIQMFGTPPVQNTVWAIPPSLTYKCPQCQEFGFQSALTADRKSGPVKDQCTKCANKEMTTRG